MTESTSQLAQILRDDAAGVVDSWLRGVESSIGVAMRSDELRQDAIDVIGMIAARRAADRSEPAPDLNRALARIAAQWTDLGMSTARVVEAVMVLKQTLFDRLRAVVSEPDQLAAEVWDTTVLVDRLGIWTMEHFQHASQDVIRRQQQELLELSTPVVMLADGILALPLIGTLDSERTQVIMESLLHSILEHRASHAIIDITGVPTVDTLVAQHLLQTVAAARLMGAECIISGIRPQIAQTIVHLGVALPNVATKSSLADAFSVALQQRGFHIARRS